jgi:hypothetical protein
VQDSGIVTQITDGWFLLAAGSTTVNISQEQAIELAKEYVVSNTWNFNGTEVSNVTVLESPVSAQFVPHPKDQYLTLFPYWYVILTLDQTYPGDVSRIAIGVWADSGQIANAEILQG